MNSSQVFVRSPDVIQVEVDQRPILLHSTRWEYLEFDPVGGAIWELLERPQSLDSLVGVLQGRYAVDEKTCGEDTQIFLDKLLRNKFLVAQA